MKYRRDYQETHDIDWFFSYKGKLYHAASNGGPLPDAIDSEKNRILQEQLEDIVGVHEVVFAERGANYYEEDADLSSFFKYASKGFISLDRTEVRDEDGEDENEVFRYHIVAYPSVEAGLFPESLLELMPDLSDLDFEIE